MISISGRVSRRSLLGVSSLGLSTLLLLSGCGGGNSGGGGSNPPPPTSYTLTVDSTNPSSGVVISVTNPLTALSSNGTTAFTLTEGAGTTLDLTAPATAGSNTFSSWSGCTSTSGTSNQDCTVTINGNMTVTANYTTPSPTAYTLTVASTNPASGVAVTASPADNNSLTGGSSQFTLNYNSGTSVVLTAPATATGGNTFSSWTGCTSTSGDTCTVTVNANMTVTANYSTPVTPTYPLTVATTNPASGVAITASPADNNKVSSGSSPLSLTYDAGTAVTLTAPLTAGGNNFSSWTGCSSTSGTSNQICTVTVNANTTVTAAYSTPTATVYAVSVHSTDPASPPSAVAVSASPTDTVGLDGGTTPVTLRYDSGTNVAITVPATASDGDTFSSWTGCASTTTTCDLTVDANITITANYVVPTPTVTITPASGSVTIGQSQQFTATVQNESNTAVTWSVAVASGSGSAGTISSTGLYETPYPAPTSVTITATSVADSSVKDSVTVNLSAPASAAGPALMVDAGDVTRPISPLIYGMNAYLLDSTTAANANITVARWGGDDTSRYNYQTGITNSANDYYFENSSGASGMLGGGTFNGFITTASGEGIDTIGTAPVLGWVSNSSPSACSFPQSTYPGQVSYNGSNCGNGVYANGSGGCTSANGCDIFGNATVAATTSVAEPPPTAPGAGNATASWADGTWAGGWVNCLVSSGSYCSATGGKDATIWDLDNEPEYWSAVHRDVHPNPMTYDEITNGGIGTALAIKTADPNAQVSGPVISGWYQYFYSQTDVNDGYGKGPCYQPWDNPLDREAHGGTPLIEYYLQQMAAASATYGVRLLDYVDIHTYFAGSYNGSSVAFTTAGDTGEQEARMNSTRVFWDPTYTDPNLPQPNYVTDPGYTTSCTQPDLPPEIIPRMQSWVTNDYPGTKTSIDEYNFGATESINGAVTQADILGIFGKYGLDMGVFWPTSGYSGQVPGNMAFEIYRNYDGSKSTFGDQELNSSTGDQSQLAVYAAERASDDAVTIVVINKTYGPLTSTLSIDNLAATGNAKVFQYSNADLTHIDAEADATVTPPVSGSTTSTISATFPAQSITLFVIPQ